MEFRLLRVDLTRRKTWTQTIDDATTKKFIGGRGLGLRLLYDETKAGIEPLGPENKLFFMTGPITGTTFPMSGRFHVVTKSPATGGIGDSDCGGDWGPELRFAGFDGVAIEGKAEKPTYLWINEGKTEFRDASKLWGKGVWDTEDMIREELGEVPLNHPKIRDWIFQQLREGEESLRPQ